MSQYHLQCIGHVHSPLLARSSAPKQGFEGSPLATIVFEPEYFDALAELSVGDEIIVLTWLDRARRDVLKVHPRDDTRIPLTGVFSTRSPDRPNPIGLHLVKVEAILGPLQIRVRDLEALHMTPVIDVKPVLKRAEA